MEDRSMASQATHAAPLREMKWSPAEKTVARRAFDLALGRELEAVVREAKDRAAKVEQPSELWELERWLTERRTGIDRKYDYRYSVLPLVLATLLSEGRLTEDDLRGLGQDKLEAVRRAAHP
jgi:Photoprotection regulator fluorescence recovery protein